MVMISVKIMLLAMKLVLMGADDGVGDDASDSTGDDAGICDACGTGDVIGGID